MNIPEFVPQRVSISIVTNIDASSVFLFMPFDWKRREPPRRRRQAHKTTIPSVKAAVCSFSNRRVRHNDVFVLETLQVVVFTVLPHVFPKRAGARQRPIKVRRLF